MTRSDADSLPPGLPRPSADALAHSKRLQARIVTVIGNAGGWISFAEYMRIALYEPGEGYYSAGTAKFGGEGDFVTAPMISPLFSRACARHMGRILRATSTAEVLEFGPGTGDFAAAALPVLRTEESPLHRYLMLEVSADLRARQQQLLGSAADLHWLSSLPEKFAGVVFANEILDAMPCERFVVRGNDWWRLGVGLQDSEIRGREPALEWRVRPADGACGDDERFQIAAELRRKEIAAAGIELPDGYCGEWQPDLSGWMNALAAVLDDGAILLADYGLPRRQLLHPDRSGGSLRCHYRHYAHGDPFLLPGLCDITAWVDFTAAAEAATSAGFEVAGFTTQAAFLLGAGIDAEFQLATSDLSATDPQLISMARGLQTLLLPGQMGESVKFMLLARSGRARDVATDPAFAKQDLRDSL